GGEAGLADRRGGVGGLVGEDRVGVDAVVAAGQGVADFQVGHDAATRPAAEGSAAGDGLDGNLAARAAVVLRVDGDGGLDARAGRGVRPVAAAVAGRA